MTGRPRGRPSGPGRLHLTNDERMRVCTLWYDACMSVKAIKAATGFSTCQISYSITHPVVASRPGRPLILTDEQQQQLITFVTGSRKGRRMTYRRLAKTLFDGQFSAKAIKNALTRHGYSRYVALKKPKINERNQQTRLAWAHEHLNWTQDQWYQMLWTDETWVIGGPHRKQYVTRRRGEEYNDTCIREKHRKKGGWMFWGSFAGITKGPGLFWEKSWGSINTESYCEHIVPLIDNFVEIYRREHNQSLRLMQDNAPGHASAATKAELRRRGIDFIPWPPFSPDLNPIEYCWDWMKDYIEEHHGLIEEPGYPLLRSWVLEAWNAMPESFLKELIDTMPLRCQAVIDANGLHTKF